MHYISEFIRAATSEIYTGMVNLPTVEVEVDEKTLPPVKPDGVTTTIKYEGGLTAVVHMTYSAKLACLITQTMMGSAPASCNAPEVADVIGELANMVGGNFNNRMAAKGFHGSSSAPSIVPNASFKPEPIPGGVALFNLVKVPAAGGEIELRVFAKV